MSVFGFPTAVTTLGHHGTGLANTFNISSVPCDLDTICADLKDLLACCAQILVILNSINIPTNQSFNTINARLDGQDAKFDAVLSAILDLRRELLRGNRDIRR